MQFQPFRTFCKEFLVLVLGIVGLSLLLWALWFIQPASAQEMAWTPDTVQQAIVSDAHALGMDPTCPLAIAGRESRFQPYVVSPTQDYGPFQIHWPNSVWSITPYGQQGIAPYDVGVDEQIRMSLLLIQSGHSDAWGVSC